VIVDDAAAELRASSRAFTRRNLAYAVARRGGTDRDIARRLRAGAVAGLLEPHRPAPARRLPQEWAAYFPAAILVVDRPAIVDLFAASGALIQARLAVVCFDGTPATVTRWLCRGLRAGFRAPVGYLHDAATIAYPFAFEPLRTLVAVGAPIEFVDLGLPPGGLPASQLPFCPALPSPVVDLEEPPPAAIVAYAARRLGALLPRDPWLVPQVRQVRSSP
jgi:hypothetical protein